MKKYVITISIIIGLLVVGIIGFLLYRNMNSNEPTKEAIKSKANEEIKQLDTTITNLVNKFHHISYANYKLVETEVESNNSKDEESSNSSSESSSSSGGGSSSGGQNQGQEKEDTKNTIKTANMEPNSILTNNDENVEWNILKEEVELLYSTWPSILIDLNSLNVNKDNLLSFTNTLDELTQALEKEDKKTGLIKLADLYNLVSEYLKEYSDDNMMNNIFATRAYVIRTYALAEDNKWDEMKQNISNAKIEYTNVLNNLLNTNNINSINRGYILLNEMEKNLNQENKDIFYINYKNLMQELETMI